MTIPSMALEFGDPIIPRRYSKSIKNAAIPNTAKTNPQGEMHFFF